MYITGASRWLAMLPSNRYGFHSNVTTHWSWPGDIINICVPVKSGDPSVNGKGNDANIYLIDS
jgi:hypothetical protein